MFAVNLRLTSIATITGEWFHCKVLNILTSFLWSIKLKITENYQGFVFYNNIDSFLTSISAAVSGKIAHTGKKKKIAPPSRHFYGLHSYQAQLSTNQRTSCIHRRNRYPFGKSEGKISQKKMRKITNNGRITIPLDLWKPPELR